MTGPLPSARLPFHGVPVGSDLGRGPMGLQGDWVHQPAVRVRDRARSRRGGQPEPQPGGPKQAATTTGAQAATAILEKRGWSEWWRWPAEALNRGCAHVHTCRVVSAPTLGRCPSRACDSTPSAASLASSFRGNGSMDNDLLQPETSRQGLQGVRNDFVRESQAGFGSKAALLKFMRRLVPEIARPQSIA